MDAVHSETPYPLPSQDYEWYTTSCDWTVLYKCRVEAGIHVRPLYRDGAYSVFVGSIDLVEVPNRCQGINVGTLLAWIFDRSLPCTEVDVDALESKWTLA